MWNAFDAKDYLKKRFELRRQQFPKSKNCRRDDNGGSEARVTGISSLDLGRHLLPGVAAPLSGEGN